MSIEFANICWFQLKGNKAFGKCFRVTWVPSGQTDIKEEVEATIWSENSNIANADTLSSMWGIKCLVGLRNPKRKTMCLEIHVTTVDGVTGFSFKGIALLCGWRLLRVSMLVRLRREQTDVYFVYFKRCTAAAKTWTG
jgi:hypothetical protein